MSRRFIGQLSYFRIPLLIALVLFGILGTGALVKYLRTGLTPRFRADENEPSARARGHLPGVVTDKPSVLQDAGPEIGPFPKSFINKTFLYSFWYPMDLEIESISDDRIVLARSENGKPIPVLIFSATTEAEYREAIERVRRNIQVFEDTQRLALRTLSQGTTAPDGGLPFISSIEGIVFHSDITPSPETNVGVFPLGVRLGRPPRSTSYLLLQRGYVLKIEEPTNYPRSQWHLENLNVVEQVTKTVNPFL